jgi:hypothetical protein
VATSPSTTHENAEVPSIEEVATGARAALERVAAARAALANSLHSWESAGATYATLGEGSTQPDLGTAAAYLEHAYDQIRTAIALLDRAHTHINNYLAIIAGPTALSTDQVETLRGDLPSPITDGQRSTGRKTHGRWIDSEGKVRKIVSGQDAQSLATRARLRTLGYPRLAVESHAEMKLAEYVRRVHEVTGQRQHVTIVVNNEICGGDLSCAELLPVLLPAGSSLTVHTPNQRRTFIGGAKP